MKNQISVEIDTDRLPTHTDEHLATLWYAAQAKAQQVPQILREVVHSPDRVRRLT